MSGSGVPKQTMVTAALEGQTDQPCTIQYYRLYLTWLGQVEQQLQTGTYTQSSRLKQKNVWSIVVVNVEPDIIAECH